MKRVLLFIVAAICFQLGFSQKTLQLQVYQVDAGTNDCDGIGAGDSDWVMSWKGGNIDDECYNDWGGNNNPPITNVSFLLVNRSISCATDWPSGNLTFTYYGDEADGLEGACSEDYSIGQSWAYPSTTNGTFNLNSGNWITLTVNECSGSDFVRYRARWIVSGSFVDNSYDNICSARNLGTVNQGYNSGWQSFNNDCATLQSGEPRPQDDYNTFWYRFTTPATGLVSVNGRVEEVSSSDNTTLTLYRSSGGCSFGSLTEIATDYGCLNSYTEIDAICLEPNTTYYWQVGTSDCITDGGETGNYRFRMTTANYAAGPDDICDATSIGTISGLTGSLSIDNQSNECATTQAGEPSGGQNTVWYTFTTGTTVGYDFNITMDAETNGLNSDITVYETCGNVCSSWSNLIEIANFWNGTTPVGEGDASGTISGRIKPNTTYYLRADGVSALGTTGGFDIDMSFSGGAYSNHDDFCDADDLGVLGSGNTITTPFYSNQNASAEESCALDEPNNDVDDETIWAKFTTSATPANEINIDVNAQGGTCTGWGALYEATSTPSCPFTPSSNGFAVLNELDRTATGGTLTIECPEPNTTYYLQGEVTGLCDRDAVQFVIEDNGWIAATNDLCVNAIDLGTVSIGGTIGSNASAWNNFCAGNAGETSLPSSCGWTTEQGVWFQFTTPSTGFSGKVDIEAYNDPDSRGDQIDLQIAIYEGSCGSLTEVDCEYDAGFFSESFNDVCLEPNKTYYILVDGSGLNTQGWFGLEVIDLGPYPTNDLPCNADVVTTQPENTYANTTITGSNIDGTNCNEPDPGWTLNGNEAGVWYKLNAPGRNLIIDANSLSSNQIDIKLGLYDGTCTNLNYVDRDYDAGTFGEDMFLTCLDPTEDYYLIVDGSFVNGEGNFELNVYYPYEGGRTTCNTGTDPARNIGTVPDGGSISYVNTSNFCGLNATDLTTSGGGSATIPAPPFTVNQAVWYKFRPPSSGSVKINANSDPVIGPALGVGSGDEINLEMAIYESADGSCAPPSWTLIDYASYSNGALSYNEELIANCLDPTKDYWLLVDGEFDATLLAGGTEGYFEIVMEDYGQETTNDLACNAIPFTTNTTELSSWNTCNSNVTVTLSGLNNYCGDNLNEPAPSAWTPLPATAKPVWFSFVAPPSGKLEIRLNTTTSLPWRQDYLNGQLAVYDLPDGEDICTYRFVAADEVVSDYDLDVPPASTGEDMTVECLVPGRTYYLMVDGKETSAFPEWSRGEFSLEFESDPRDAPAPNDLVCDAKDLGDPTGGSVGSNVNDASLLNSPQRNPSDPAYCMRAENSFCAGTADDPALNGLTLWGFDNTVWYTFTGPSTGSVRIDVDGNVGIDGDEFAPQVVAYESSDGTCNGTLYDLQATPTVSSGFGTSASMDLNCLNVGQTYFIAVDGGPLALEAGDINGYFEIEVTEITPTEFPPSHNDICDAKIIDPFTSMVSISNDTNRCSNREFTIPDPSTFTRDRTVWYRFTTPTGAASYAVEIDVNSQLGWPFGDAVDPQVAVYESSDNTCSGTITEHFSDYSAAGLPLSENAEVHCLQPGTTYWIMVDGSAINTQGFFDITVESITPNPLPTNDFVCDGVDLGTLGSVSGNTVGGTTTNYFNFCADTVLGEPTPDAFGIEQTVWFSFVTPNLGSPSDGVNVDIEVLNDPNNVGDQIDAQVAIYQSSDGTCSGVFTEVESADNGLSFNANINDICLLQNTRYFIQVDGSALNGEGYFTVEVTNDGTSARPVNDDFCNATALTLGATQAGDNGCATLETAEPNAGTNVQKSVWYSFVAPPSGRVEIRTEDTDGASSGIDPEWRLYEFDGTCAGSFTGTFTQLASAYFPTLGLGNPDDVADYECLFPGETYYIQVDGTTVGGDEGTFNITVTDLEPDYGTNSPTDKEPANNTCDNATTLTVQSESCFYGNPLGTWQVENYGLPTRTVPDNTCGTNCGETWYQFTMPSTGFVKIEGDDEYGTLGVTNSDLVVVAYRGTCGALVEIDCDQGGFGSDVDYSISGTPGETILLQVFDNNGDDLERDFGICISERCAADECEDALAAPNILGEGPQCFDVRDATGEDIAGGDNGYGVGGVPSNNPQNSVYFAFETDDFCWGYELTLTTTDVGSIGGLGGQEVVMSVYEDDGTPCQHDAGEPVLDIQTFDRSVYPSGVTFNITYETGTLPDQIKANTRYIIQIEGNSTTVDGTIEVRKICDGREWAYATDPVTTSDGYCFDGEWRHYYNENGTPGDPSDDILLFSVKPNGNLFDGIATITLDATPGEAINPSTLEASWSMRRYWDFEITSTFNDSLGLTLDTIDPSKPVDVRFYYQDAEKTEIITLANDHITNNPSYGLVYEPFEWFKSEDGVVFDPSVHVTPPNVIAGYGSGAGPTITGGGTIVSTGVGTTVTAYDHDAEPTNEFCNGVQYVVYEGLTGFSGGTGATGASESIGSPLPVDLLYFNGEKTERGNYLTWATVSELDNDYFVLEHSVDGETFEEVTRIGGAGTSSSTHYYSYYHNDYANGYNYYRLKQVDFDGAFEYSRIVPIDNTEEEEVEESLILSLYPNPSTFNSITLDVFIANAGEYRIEVHNLVGKVVYAETKYLEEGESKVSIEYGKLSDGSYIIEMIDVATNQRVKKKFINSQR